jgi:hypothetical protein
MLHTPTPFPHPGSIAYRARTAEPARILRWNDDGTVLIERRERTPDGGNRPIIGCSANTTVPVADLYADPLDAAGVGRRQGRRTRRALKA